MSDPTAIFIWLLAILMLISAGALVLLAGWLNGWIGEKSSERWEVKGSHQVLPPPEPLTIVEHTQSKTLFDIVQILIIPVLLAGLSPYLTNLVNTSNQNIALDQQREAILDAYINNMSDLLLKNDIRVNLHSSKKPSDDVRQVANARTLMALQQLDPQRKGFVILFLYRTNLINKENVIVTLHQADLRHVTLSGVYLDDCSLHDAVLSNADVDHSILSNADVSFSYFDEANLEGTDFSHTFLYDANLYHADVKETRFIDADMRHVNLQDTDLTEAKLNGANLAGANLKDAKVTPGQLQNVFSLHGTIMPDGSVHG